MGNANVICSDKTGTLTQNKMTVTEIKDVNGDANIKSSLGEMILSYGVLCNNAEIISDNKGVARASGEPTENALILAGGIGSRMGEDTPKQFFSVGDKPIIIYTTEKFLKNKKIDKEVTSMAQNKYFLIINSPIK